MLNLALLDVGSGYLPSGIEVPEASQGPSLATLGLGVILAWAALGACAVLLRVPVARRRHRDLEGSPALRYRTLVLAFLGAAAVMAMPLLREHTGGLLKEGWRASGASWQHAAPVQMAVEWARPLVAAAAWPVSPAGRALSWLAMLWSAAVAVSLVRALLGHLRLVQRCRRALPAPPLVRARANMVARRLGMKVPDLWVSDETEVPFATGLLSPCIVLPRAELEGFSTEQLDFVLHHEMVHIDRGDLRAAFLIGVARMLFTGHPAQAGFVSEIAWAREASVDARVAEGSPLQYASFLLELAHRLSIQSHMKGTLPMADSNLSRRIALLLSRAAHAPTRRQRRAVVCLIAGGTALAAGVWLAPTSWAAPSAAPAPAHGDHCDAGVTAE